MTSIEDECMVDCTENISKKQSTIGKLDEGESQRKRAKRDGTRTRTKDEG